MSYVTRKAKQVLKRYTHWKSDKGGIWVYDDENPSREDTPNYYENELDFLKWHGYSGQNRHAMKKHVRKHRSIYQPNKPF